MFDQTELSRENELQTPFESLLGEADEIDEFADEQLGRDQREARDWDPSEAPYVDEAEEGLLEHPPSPYRDGIEDAFAPGGEAQSPLSIEDEGLLGDFWSSASRVAERAMVMMAVARGERDETRLTDMVFHRRHPERTGRAISRGEPNYSQLAAEWTAIRNTVIRPVLTANTPRVGAVSPGATRPAIGSSLGSAQPGQAAIGTPTWCAVTRQRMVASAQTELPRWRDPTTGAQRLENDRRQLPVLEQYWAAVPGFQSPGRAAAEAQRSAANSVAWSAAFICHVVRSAGVNDRQGFEFARRHMNYIVGALRNRERGDTTRPFWLFDPIEAQLEAVPEPGDLLCFNRRLRLPDGTVRRTRHSYASLRRAYWVGRNRNRRVFGSSHTSVVVDTQTRGGRGFAVTVGGNERHSVRQDRVALDSSGGLANPAGDHIFGLIKIVGC